MPTIARVATNFIERPELSPLTKRDYESVLARFVSHWGILDIAAIDRDGLRSYLSDTLDGIGYTTHNKHQRIINALFNYALSEELIQSNPCARLKPKKPDAAKGEHWHEEIRYLTEEQLELFWSVLENSKNIRLHALCRLLYESGARIDEVLGCDREALEMQSLKFLVVGKRNKQRWCYFSESARDLLCEYLEYYHVGNRALFLAEDPVRQRTSRLSYARAYQELRGIVEEIPEIAAVRFHALRHTFATERVGTMQIEELRALMGHEDIKTTLRYAKVTSQKAEEAARKAFALVGKGVGSRE